MRTETNERHLDFDTGNRIITGADHELSSLAPNEYFVSPLLSFYRSIKIECTAGVFAQFGPDIFGVVQSIDASWGLRFSIFSDLMLPDSYLFGVIFAPDGQIFIEDSTII